MKYKKGMFKGKKITVMGLGLLGRGVGDITFLASEGADLIVTDLKTKVELATSLNLLKQFKNIHYTLGKHDIRDFENIDFVLKAAGVPLTSVYIAHAWENRVPVFMSTALFAKLTEATIVGITGTRGKTTVTHMVYEILNEAFRGKKQKIYIGGNIQGMATLPLVKTVKKGDIIVLELDSWQLQGFGDLKISPHIAVFTTFMPDHLNYYKGDLKKYFGDKANIFLNQTKKDAFFAGEQLKKSKFKLPTRTRYVSTGDLPHDVLLSIPGEHNRYNAALAYIVSKKLGVKDAVIKKSLSSFGGVAGRLEKVKTYNGVDIYNDTTATTPHALVSALEAVGKKQNIVLIMGGSDKTIDLEILKKPLQKYCKHVVLLAGTGTERLLKEKVVSVGKKVSEAKDFSSAVKKVLLLADAGDTVLLSPGFASFGMFKNEYDRGDQFNSLIKKFSKKG